LSALVGLAIIFGPAAALLASVVAVVVDRPKGFAIAGLTISGLTCLLIGGLIVFAIAMMGRL
jgi:hypothetical protein